MFYHVKMHKHVCICIIPSLVLNPFSGIMSDFNGEGSGGIEVADCIIKLELQNLSHVYPLGHDQADL